MQSVTRYHGANSLKPKVSAFYDATSGTFSYVVQDPSSSACAIIDPLLDFDLNSGELQHRSADAIVRYVESKRLQVQWLIETHVHTDHLSAAQYLKDVLGGKTAIAGAVCKEQRHYARLLNLPRNFKTDGSQFDWLFRNAEHYLIGNMQASAIYTPGHGLSCMAHLIGNAVFTGDTLLMPDIGTGRADLPGANRARLFHSARKILRLPARTRLFVGHDYGGEERAYVEYQTTIGQQRRHNCLVSERSRESEFLRRRSALDKQLPAPELLFAAAQVNIRGGHLPPPESNEICYLKIPLRGSPASGAGPSKG